MSKKNILIFIDWFYPAFKAGGPIKSIHNMVDELNPYFEFLIITSNTDFGGELIEVLPNKIHDKNTFKVIYLDQNHQNKKTWLSIYDDFKPDWIYFNSLFSLNYTLRPYFFFRKIDVKKLIAPRGMLGEGSLAIKASKKKLFLQIAKNFLFDKDLFWHATTIEEKHQIKSKIGINTKVRYAQNISSGLSKRDEHKKVVGKISLVFLSRISPIKNLEWLINLMESYQKNDRLQLDIYGPFDSISYKDRIMSIISRNEFSTYKGEVNPIQITKTLQQYDFYILPSLHENYGHSIIEALQSGVPVIISNKTPWRGLKQEGVGFDLSIEFNKEWENAFNSIVEMDNRSYAKMVENCYHFSKKYILNSQVLEQNLSLFNSE